MNEGILFTPAALLDLLIQIDELKGVDVGVTESPDGTMYVKIGRSTYTIDTSNVTEIPVDEEVVETVQDVNEDAYMNLNDSEEVFIDNDPETVESGIIKELAKTLLLGGMVRLSAKWLRGDKK